MRDPGKTTSPADRLAHENVEGAKWDRWLRIGYAVGTFLLLVPQLCAMNYVMIQLGLGNMHLSDTLMGFYMTGTLAEVFLIVRLIVTYLFRMPK